MHKKAVCLRYSLRIHLQNKESSASYHSGVKNRFGDPTTAGWCAHVAKRGRSCAPIRDLKNHFYVCHRADCMVNFSFLGDAKEHICEMQLIHQEMMTGSQAYCVLALVSDS